MMSSEDYTNTGCKIVFTSPDLIRAETICDLLVGLLQIFMISPKLVCPKLVSLMFEWSAWNLDFVEMPWNLKTIGFGAIFSAKDEQDTLISTKKYIH